MSTLSLRLPDSLHKRAREVAEREGTSMNQLFATALAEKLSALDTVAYLEERGARGSRKEFLRALGGVPSREPTAGDEPVKPRKSRRNPSARRAIAAVGNGSSRAGEFAGAPTRRSSVPVRGWPGNRLPGRTRG